MNGCGLLAGGGGYRVGPGDRSERWFGLGALAVFVALAVIAVFALAQRADGPGVQVGSVVKERLCTVAASPQADLLDQSAAYLRGLGGPERDILAARLEAQAAGLRAAAAQTHCPPG